MDYDEDLQKYVTAVQTRDQNFNHALVADRAEHAKHEPSHNEARAFLTRQRAAELKRYQPSATPERLQQYIDGEERNVAAQAIVLGASPAAEIHRIAREQYGFQSKAQRQKPKRQEPSAIAS